MVFTSEIFIFYFFPLFLLLYFLFKKSNTVLLLFSLFFYFWTDQFLVLILISSAIIDFLAGKNIYKYRQDNKDKAKLILKIALVSNLSLLAYFKYCNFFIHEINLLLTSFNIESSLYTNIALPLGISFYTFQSMSYSIDIYYGNTKPTNSFQNFLTYVSMFPQLIAGPIVRYKDIAHEIQNRTITKDLFFHGVQRFIIGFFKKAVLANNLQIMVDFYYQGFELLFYEAWLVAFAFMVLVYLDFSAYSDMAIGLGRMLGFNIPENFKYPHASLSIREFWTRWHISLSSWFRDYLYIPLGGSKKSSLITYRNLFIVFLLCGLWHGANWTFIVFGFYHGFFMTIERVFPKLFLSSNLRPLRIFYMNIIIMFGLVFFNSKDMNQVFSIYSSFFNFSGFEMIDLKYEKQFIYQYIVLFIGALIAFPIIPKLKKKYDFIKKESLFYNTSLIIMFIFSLIEIVSNEYQPFIYFKF